MRTAVLVPVISALALWGVAAPVSAAPGPAPAKKARPAVAIDWTRHIEATPQGGLRIGNPDARLQLLEYGSFTCSHCKAFHDEGLPPLKARYVATGKLAYEFRSFARNGADFVATLLAVCQPPKPQLRFMDALFGEEDRWLQGFIAISDADNKALAALPVEKQFAQLARLGKLDAWAAGHGVAPAKAAACLADKAAMDQVVNNQNQAVRVFGLTGTPTFVLNGKTVADTYSWDMLEPKLAEALR